MPFHFSGVMSVKSWLASAGMNDMINPMPDKPDPWKRLINPYGVCRACKVCFSSHLHSTVNIPVPIMPVEGGNLVACHSCGTAFVLLDRHVKEHEELDEEIYG